MVPSCGGVVGVGYVSGDGEEFAGDGFESFSVEVGGVSINKLGKE